MTGIDAITDYYPAKIKKRNLAGLLKHPQFHFQKGNLNRLDLAKFLKSTDVVFHQAAQPGVRASWGQSFHIYMECNISATQRLLEAAKGLKNIKKFVYASSSSVYGKVDSLPMRESQRCSPFSPYGVTKYAAEHLCQLYHSNYGVPSVSLRYFTVYGPRQRPDMAFHRFMESALSDRPIRIFGSGRQSRDFTYVDDIVSANIAAGEKGREGAVYNLGGGSRIMLIDALKILEKAVGKKLQLKREQTALGDVDRTGADTSLAKKEIGFRPQTTLAEGLRAQAAWHRKMREEGILPLKY